MEITIISATMTFKPNHSLVNRLHDAASIWANSTGKSLAALGRAVMNDPGFFKGLKGKPQGTTTATLEKFAAFLIEPANWAGDDGAGQVPAEVAEFCHVVGNTAPAVDPSSGKTSGNSHKVAA